MVHSNRRSHIPTWFWDLSISTRAHFVTLNEFSTLLIPQQHSLSLHRWEYRFIIPLEPKPERFFQSKSEYRSVIKIRDPIRHFLKIFLCKIDRMDKIKEWWFLKSTHFKMSYHFETVQTCKTNTFLKCDWLWNYSSLKTKLGKIMSYPTKRWGITNNCTFNGKRLNMIDKNNNIFCCHFSY